MNLMNERELIQKYDITEDQIERSAETYEIGDYPHEDGPIYVGSHVDAVGKKRITVVFDASTTQRVNALAARRGVNPSDIYRDAVKTYLASQA